MQPTGKDDTLSHQFNLKQNEWWNTRINGIVEHLENEFNIWSLYFFFGRAVNLTYVHYIFSLVKLPDWEPKTRGSNMSLKIGFMWHHPIVHEYPACKINVLIVIGNRTPKSAWSL